jgi:DivIVA domain-containing protein
VSEASPPAPSGDAVGRRTFSTSFRGFDQAEVRSYLDVVAGEFRALRERIVALEIELEDAHAVPIPAAPVVDIASITTALGEETARVLRTAQEAAEDLRTRAEEGAARALKDAHDAAAAVRAAADAVLGERTIEAEDAATRIRQESEDEATQLRKDAAAQAEGTIANAVSRGKEMLAQAQAARERVLSDLARRRRLALAQIEQLRSGRQRLEGSLEAARAALASITDDLNRSDEEARRAAEAVGGPTNTANVTSAPDEPSPSAADVVEEPDPPQPEVASAPVDEEIEAPEPAEVVDDTTEHGDAPILHGGVRLLGVHQAIEPAADVAAPAEAPAEAGEVEEAAAAPEAPAENPPEEVPAQEAPVAEVAAAEAPAAGVHGAGVPAAEVPAAGVSAKEEAPAEDQPEEVPTVQDPPSPAPAALVPVVSEPPPDAAPSRRRYRHDPVPSAGLPETAVGPPVTDPGTGKVDTLFARIRADRATEVTEAKAILAETVASDGPNGAEQPEAPAPPSEPVAAPEPVAPSEPVAVAEDASLEAPRSDADEAYLQRRDELLEPIAAAAAKALKRALADDHNVALDRLRTLRSVPATVDSLLGEEDAELRAMARSVAAALADAAAAGGVLAFTDDPPAPDPSLVAPIAAALAAEVVGALRLHVAAVLEAADGDKGGRTVDNLNSAYRERRGRLDRTVGDAMTEAVSAGFGAALEPGTLVRWVVEDADGPCPDCDDNALAGPTPLGSAFPTGQVAPPAHPGCRCVLARTAL